MSLLPTADGQPASPAAGLKLDAATGTHIGDKPEQQDRLAIIPAARGRGVALAIVADGMGGRKGGALAAQTVIETATEAMKDFVPGARAPQEFLHQLAQDAHAAIRINRFLSDQEPHSTVVAMLVQPGRVDWMHCGDSRLMRVRERRMVSQTLDHSYIEQLIREGKATPEERNTHPKRNLLVSVLGGERAPAPSVDGTDKLVPGDTFLLCTDGLWGYFTDAEIAGVLSTLPPRPACQKLIEAARVRARGHGDNLSLVVIRFS